MGYLVSAHLLFERPAGNKLKELPASIGYDTYHLPGPNVYAIDTYRASRKPTYPFQTALPAADITDDLPSKLETLEEVYRYLARKKQANSFKKLYINFACLLSHLLACPVLSLISDDDEWDFACTAVSGSLTRLSCRCSDLQIIYDNGKTTILPLIPEFEDDEDPITDLNDLMRALPGVNVSDRVTQCSNELHSQALREWHAFSGHDTSVLGLGSFDPPDDESEWKLIESR